MPVGTRPEPMTDEQVVERVLGGETALFELLMRRHNTRVYRAVRGVLGSEEDVEDAMQQAYVNAYTHLGQFAGRARFSTWLTRIALHEAIARARRRGTRMESGLAGEEGREDEDVRLAAADPSPEHKAFSAELRTLLEEAIDALPPGYREVFMLREVEGLSTSEAADSLELTDEAVKTRLHRARALLKERLLARTGAEAADAFQFHAVRCDSVVSGVLERIGAGFRSEDSGFGGAV